MTKPTIRVCPFLLLSALVAVALVPGCSCEKKSSSASSTPAPPAAVPLPPAVRLGAGGGAIERGTAKLEIPKGALAKDQDVRFGEVRTVPVVSYKPAGSAYYFAAEQGTFAAPLTVTLPLDKSRLPADVQADHVYAVFAIDGMGEVLDQPPPKVDLVAGTVTVLLTRSFPLASGDAGGAGGGPVLQPAFDPGGLDTLETTPRLRWRAAHGLDKAKEMVERGKAIMKLVRQNFDPLGMPDPGQITITFKSMNPAWGGVCTGPNSFEVNSDKFLGDSLSKERAEFFGKKQGGTFMHEYFHCLQFKAFQHALQTLKTPLPGEYHVRGKTQWVKEATATWMQEFMSGAGAESNLPRLKPDFCYKPLNLYEADSPNPHQYAACIFFSWLDTLYSSKLVIVRLFNESFSGTWKHLDDLERDGIHGRGTFNPLDVLDHILRDTPDNKGRKRTLREVYAEFLLHYGWLKDFAPIKGSTALAVLGQPREITLPGDKTTTWTLPVQEGGSRVSKKSETVAGEGFHIVRAFLIAKGLKDGEKGDLVVSLKAGERSDPKESMVVVFPLKKGPEDPEIGTSDSPAKIRNWHETNGAIVWVVDLSVIGEPDLTVTAEVKPASDVRFQLTVSPPRDALTEYTHFQANFTFEFAPPDGLDTTTAEGKSKFREVADKWARELRPEWEARYRWLHVQAIVEGKTFHYYGRIGNTNPPGASFIWGPMILPRKPGAHAVEATVAYKGESYKTSFSVTVKLPDDREAYNRDAIAAALKSIEKAKADERQKLYLAREYRSLGYYYAGMWNDDAAVEAWTTGLSYATDPGDKKELHRSLGENAFQRGDIAAWIDGLEKAGEIVNWAEAAQWTLAIENDWRKATVLKRKVPGIKEEDLDRFRIWPIEGDEILE
ncbi:MAG: hypothetical protein FD180_246 [Planctomycetota bacterium]|nr:MAG: hypothetical protein FD180_246 [Planctomycetota bacterium]